MCIIRGSLEVTRLDRTSTCTSASSSISYVGTGQETVHVGLTSRFGFGTVWAGLAKSSASSTGALMVLGVPDALGWVGVRIIG